MSEQERERLKNREQQRNPGAAFNNALNQAITGNPNGSGCLLIVVILLIFLLFKACSS
ncbi:hypothetical protein K7887_03035 [Sutcliffiella horikoshii]|uniref:hypothetical protein n=1 Tax=Sutcliffiella horikoshii TaxID=79883 RepID=UPI001CBAD4A5|nr:hypothetical protein [Sutcliffiella horikoshii]UAL47960.1 hypothetical protein K7887_03035 [Sutcliffiella horikoshii]